MAQQARDADEAGIRVGSVPISLGDETTVQDLDENKAWALAQDNPWAAQLHVMFCEYHNDQLAIQAGMAPVDRFVVQTYDGHFEVQDRLAPVNAPSEYIVTWKQLVDDQWGVADIVQREWDSWITCSPRDLDYQGFQVQGVDDTTHPALYWLRAQFKARLEDEYAEFPAKELLAEVRTHSEGYEIVSPLLNESDGFVLLHKDIREPSFDPQRLIQCLLDEYTMAELTDRLNSNQRRKRCRQALLLGAAKYKQTNLRRGTSGKGSDDQRDQAKSTVLNAVERNAMKPKDFTRSVPMPIVVAAQVNRHTIRALLDTGSMADFLSTTIADQLGLTLEILEKPLPVQLAVHSSQSKINCCTTVDFAYQDVACKRRFDVVNLDDHDMILGTPFLFQHQDHTEPCLGVHWLT